ncbi:MAG: hypothetical protein MI862_06395 [Desulfobacterales bacterium]|nr:hypothetical protein [Desulfobacterales bacterium]
MKKIIVLFAILLIFAFTMSLHAESYDDNSLLRFTGGGGMVEVYFIDFSELNNKLIKNDFAPLGNQMITYGGEFFSQTNENLRYSFFGAGGFISASKANDKVATFSLSHGGIWLEKIFPLNDQVAFSGGLAASLGGYELELVHSKPKSFFDPIQSSSVVAMFMLKPQIGVNYSIKRYFDLEVKLGYGYSHTLGGWIMGNSPLPGEAPLEQLHGFTFLLNMNFGF